MKELLKKIGLWLEARPWKLIWGSWVLVSIPLYLGRKHLIWTDWIVAYLFATIIVVAIDLINKRQK